MTSEFGETLISLGFMLIGLVFFSVTMMTIERSSRHDFTTRKMMQWHEREKFGEVLPDPYREVRPKKRK